VALRAARNAVRDAIARTLATELRSQLNAPHPRTPYSPDPVAAGRRSLHNAALALLVEAGIDGADRLAQVQIDHADNMTDRLGAISALVQSASPLREPGLAAYESLFVAEPLAMDKWFTLQIALSHPDTTATLTQSLTQHSDFDMKNPNRFRSVIGGLTANHAGFHHASGAGYSLLADWLIKLDAVNPQTAARMSTAFEAWPRYDAGRRAHACAALDRILAAKGLSRNLSEMAQRIRAAG
jgi:aminopeptidase N